MLSTAPPPPVLPGKRLEIPAHDPLKLDSGAVLGPLTLAYQTYGTLDSRRANAVLVCHALTGDQFVAEPHPITGKPGWWEILVGPGRILDTNRYFVICVNVIGGCMGVSVAVAMGAYFPARCMGLLLHWPVGGFRWRAKGILNFDKHIAFARQHGLAAVAERARNATGFWADPEAGPWATVLRNNAVFAAK